MQRSLWLVTRRSLFPIDETLCLSLSKKRNHLVVLSRPSSPPALRPQGAGGRRWIGTSTRATAEEDVGGDHDASDTPTLRFSTLRRIIKPFLLKCHPDTTPTPFAKKVNLSAIQSLNGYLETIRSRLVASEQRLAIMRHHRSKDDPPILELDFILTLDIATGKKKDRPEDSTSRRRVELLYPPDSIQTVPQLYAHSRRELLKLIKVAGLDVPPDFIEMESSFRGDSVEDDDSTSLNNEDHHPSARKTAGGVKYEKSPYEISRDRFVRNIQWQNYDRLYEKAVKDMETDIMTEGLVQKFPGRRRAVIAQILSRVTLQAAIDIPTQLITFRRLSLLLDEHFFNFELEDHGKLWESRCRILLCPARRNNSASALHRRKEGGFLFTVHPNMTLTIHIPVDFRDEEFHKEIGNNIWHFYDLFEEDGMAELFPAFA